MKDDFVLWFDDSNTASPKEEKKYALQKVDEHQLDACLEKIWSKFNIDALPPEEPTDCSNVAKYLLEKVNTLTTWQLQKLCYYAQAWHYTWTNKRLIRQDFYAWRNGPVCTELYALHKGKKSVNISNFSFADTNQLSHDAKDSIDVMLEHYGKLSGDELVELTHSEEPWIKARGDLSPYVNSDQIISLESMGEYYHKHLI